MDDVVILITESDPTYDSEGNPTYTRTEQERFVRERSVTRSEFYTAAQADLQPEKILILSNYIDYDGQRLAEYHGQEYSIIRTYRAPESDELELVLSKRLKNGN